MVSRSYYVADKYLLFFFCFVSFFLIRAAVSRAFPPFFCLFSSSSLQNDQMMLKEHNSVLMRI